MNDSGALGANRVEACGLFLTALTLAEAAELLLLELLESSSEVASAADVVVGRVLEEASESAATLFEAGWSCSGAYMRGHCVCSPCIKSGR